MRILPLLMALAASVPLAPGAELWRANFSSDLGGVLQSVPKDVSLEAPANSGGGPSLRIGAPTAFKDVPVSPRQRIRVKFSARCAAGVSVESQPFMPELLEGAVWNDGAIPWKFPSCVIEFRTSDGGRRKDELYSTRRWPVFSSEPRDYTLEFYVPEDAAALRVLFRPGAGNALSLWSLSVEDVDMRQEKYLNVNPDFGLGPFNPSGIGHAHRGRLGVDGFGKPYLDAAGSWFMGDYIPVEPGWRLRLSYAGENSSTNRELSLSVSFLRSCKFADSDKVGQNKMPIRLEGKAREGVAEMTVPEGGRWARIGGGWGTVRCLRLEKLD